jgi:hypothetical protein
LRRKKPPTPSTRPRRNANPRSAQANLELQSLQRSIHASLLKEAASLLGKTPPGIRAYEKTYGEELERLERSMKPISLAKVLRRAESADVILIGDYHTYGQSQRAALRFMRELAAKIPPREMVLAVECVSSQHQLHIDRWLRGQISEEALLQAIHYDSAWGFPWENYRGIFLFARDHGMEIIALNRPRDLLPPLAAIPSARKTGDLGARDEWAGGLLVDELMRPRPRKCIAIYGEYHLSPSHLPAAIREIARKSGIHEPKLLVLHQNRDELFWKLASQGLEQQAHLVDLAGDHLCVFSGTPWTKLQSLVNWIQGDLARFVDEDDEDAEDEFLQWMRIYGDGVARFFQLPDADYSILQLAKWDDLQGGPRWWRKLLRSQERFYVREDAASVLVYVSSFSENAAAEVASVHLLHHDNPRKRPFVGKGDAAADDFASSVLDHAFGFLGSLLINPRRKCDYPVDHASRLIELRKKPKTALFPHEAEARKLFIDLATRGKLRSERIQSSLKKRSPECLFTVSRFLGHWYGARLHEALLAGKKSPAELRLFFYDRRRADPWNRLLELSAGRTKRSHRTSKRDFL